MTDSPSTTVEPTTSSKPNRLPVVLLLGVLIIGAGEAARRWITQELDPPVTTQTDNRLMESEGLILDLTPRLKELLNTSVLNLSLPDALGVEMFAAQATVVDLSDEAPH